MSAPPVAHVRRTLRIPAEQALDWKRDATSWYTEIEGYEIRVLHTGIATTQVVGSHHIVDGRHVVGRRLMWHDLTEALSALGWEPID